MNESSRPVFKTAIIKKVSTEAAEPEELTAEVKLSPQQEQKVREYANRLEIKEANSLVAFAIETLRRISKHAQYVLEHIKNKDSGSTDELLHDLSKHVRMLGAGKLRAPSNFIQKIIYLIANPLEQFVRRYDSVSKEIDGVSSNMDAGRQELMRDIALLENQYKVSTDQFQELGLFLKAAELKLAEWDSQILPELNRFAKLTQNTLDQQSAAAANRMRDDLERKKTELELTRAAMLRSLPSVRAVQSMDKSLVGKLQGGILSTLPEWQEQVESTIRQIKKRGGVDASAPVSPVEQDDRKRRPENIEVEPSPAVMDFAPLKKINDHLVLVIEETIQITNEIQEKRTVATRDLLMIESSLKAALQIAQEKGL